MLSGLASAVVPVMVSLRPFLPPVIASSMPTVVAAVTAVFAGTEPVSVIVAAAVAMAATVAIVLVLATAAFHHAIWIPFPEGWDLLDHIKPFETEKLSSFPHCPGLATDFPWLVKVLGHGYTANKGKANS
jgi:hypothetical protein